MVPSRLIMDTVERIAMVSAGHIGKGEMVKSVPATASRHIGRSAWNVMAFAGEKSFCDKEMASIRTPRSSHEVRKSELSFYMQAICRRSASSCIKRQQNHLLRPYMALRIRRNRRYKIISN